MFYLCSLLGAQIFLTAQLVKVSILQSFIEVGRKMVMTHFYFNSQSCLGSKTAIEVVSLGVSRRNQSTLQNLLTLDCQEKEQKCAKFGSYI